MYKIMFVDDEPWAVIDIMHSIPWDDTGFTMAGYWEYPEDALHKIVDDKPDLVFIDILMPAMNGFELIKKCRELGSKAEFIILSGYSDFHYAKQAIKSAVVDYCLKPINPNAFMGLLKELKLTLDDRFEPSYSVHPNTDTPETFSEILSYMHENYYHKLALTHLAEHFHFNKNYICYLFKKHTKTTFTVYLTQLRIEAAKKLLKNSDIPLTDIATKVGFTDSYYFGRVFKTECGYSPAQYRRMEEIL